MAVSSYQALSWDDRHTVYLSHLYTLYCEQIYWDRQLCDIGYHGYPDPIYESDDKEITPDFLAFGDNGDVQHIELLACNGLNSKPDPEVALKSQLNQVSEFDDISPDMVSSYLSLHGDQYEPETQEVVVLLPSEVYDSHQNMIQEEVDKQGHILWLIQTNGSAEIWKEAGTHANLDLDSELEDPYESYPDGTDLLQFTRGTNKDQLRFAFTHRLIKHCSRETKRKFEFEEVDEIMTQRPPMLGHLTKEERENKYWPGFLFSLINRFELLETTGQNEYQWTKKQFVKEPRYRQRILKELAHQLDLEVPE